MPIPGQEGLTEDANSILKKQNELGLQSTGDIVNTELAGTKSAQNLQDNAIGNAKDIALGGSSPQFVKEALNRRSSKQFENLGLQMKNQAKMNADSRLSNQSNIAFQAQAQKQQIANQAYQRDLMDQQNRRAARNQIISTITTGLGMGAGFIMSGGNPKGAQKGGQVGAAAGPNSEMKYGLGSDTNFGSPKY